MAAAAAIRRKQGRVASASAVVLSNRDRVHGTSHVPDLPRASLLGSKQGPKPGSTPATRTHSFIGVQYHGDDDGRQRCSWLNQQSYPAEVLPAAARRIRSSSAQRHPPRMPTPPPKGDVLGRNGEPQRFVTVIKAFRAQQVTIGGQGEQRILESRGPAGFRAPVLRAASPRTAGIPDTGGLELCCFDPRRPPRPPPDPRGHPMGLGVGLVAVADGFPPRVIQATPPLLAVSGQAAAVNPHPAASSSSPPPEAQGGCELQPQDFSSSEDDVSDGEDSGFRYRKYRFQETWSRAKPQASEPQRKRGKRPVPSQSIAAKRVGTGDERPVPWITAESTDQAWPVCEDDRDVMRNNASGIGLDKQEAEQLDQVAQVLVQFYGLPGGPEVAIKPRGSMANMVAVEESAWSKRKRESQLEEPPVMFVRGGRVYDFHGDRGTLAEFEHDLLTRQVEDDTVCRTRRLEQGLMPFPFKALPLKQNTEDQADENR